MTSCVGHGSLVRPFSFHILNFVSIASKLEHLRYLVKLVKGKFIRKKLVSTKEYQKQISKFTFKEGLLIKSYSFYVILIIFTKSSMSSFSFGF